MLEHFEMKKVKAYLQASTLNQYDIARNDILARYDFLKLRYDLYNERYDITRQSHAEKEEGMTFFELVLQAKHGMTFLSLASKLSMA